MTTSLVFWRAEHPKADVDDVAIVHWVVCCACVGCANEEARHKGIESVVGMPVGCHSLSILVEILCCHFAVLCDEPVDHV